MTTQRDARYTAAVIPTGILAVLAQVAGEEGVDVGPPDAPWSVALYSNNLFDKRYVTGISNISATTLGTPFASISAPRLWGVAVAAHF